MQKRLPHGKNWHLEIQADLLGNRLETQAVSFEIQEVIFTERPAAVSVSKCVAKW